jgi:predicted nucleotidyltransferase
MAETRPIAELAIVDRIVDGVRTQAPRTIAIYRFGSWLSAAERADSDVDIALRGERPLDSEAHWRLTQALAQRIGRDVDLIDLSAASTVLRAQVVSTGERIYCADQRACETFEDLVFSDYARLNEERARILEDIRSRGSILCGTVSSIAWAILSGLRGPCSKANRP